MGYRIKTVAEMVGVPKNTLLAWERRHGLVEPERLDNGYRVYSDGDVAILRRVKRALDEGLAISEAVDLVRAEIAAQKPLLPRPVTEGITELRARLEAALLEFDRAAAEAICARLVGIPFPALIDDLYLPILVRVGARWARGEATVAQEHHASSFIRDQLIGMLLSVGSGPEHGTSVVCTTFPGEQHELATLALAVRLALAGAHVTYLGANLPLGDLSAYGREQRPAWVLVSVIVDTPSEVLEAYAEALSRELPATTRVVIGGAGLPEPFPSVAGVRFARDWRSLELL